MLALNPQIVHVTCPKCGQTQREDFAAPSVVCVRCGHGYGLLQGSKPAIDFRFVNCFHCGLRLEVSTTAVSTICKQCSTHLDLCDYHVSSIVLRSFKTAGRLVIEKTGYVHDTAAVVGDAVIKGKFRGNLVADRSLTICSTAEIYGTIKAARLVIPLSTRFRWHKPLRVKTAEIYGELTARLYAEEIVLLASTARFFGNLHAGSLEVQAGALLNGSAKVGSLKTLPPG